MAESSLAQRHVYFPGLNALRFYAAMSVVVAHTSNNFAELRTRPSHYTWLNAVALDAQSAVTLFFVLSGFLITYLLFEEQKVTGDISVRRFYARRIMRIWPLYYLIVLIGLAGLPILLGPDYALYSPSLRTVIMVAFLFSNFIGGLGPPAHLWSIALEEQFYLVWPWVIKRKEGFLKSVIGVILVKLMVAPVVPLFRSDLTRDLFLGLRFESMAVGALGAYVYFSQHRLLHWVYSLPAQLLCLIGLAYLALVEIPLNVVTIMATSLLFIVLILNVSTNPRALIRLENRLLNRLGQISYGIYMYHFPLLYVVLFTRWRLGLPEDGIFDAILYTATIGGTLLLAFITYRWFEMPFLNLKARFAVIESRR